MPYSSLSHQSINVSQEQGISGALSDLQDAASSFRDTALAPARPWCTLTVLTSAQVSVTRKIQLEKEKRLHNDCKLAPEAAIY